MAAQLSPEQQAALDDFTDAADLARTAADADHAAKEGLTNAQAEATRAAEERVSSLAAAKTAAQKFVDAMIPPEVGAQLAQAKRMAAAPVRR